MNIHEHQAKKILKEFGAPIAAGVAITNLDEAKSAMVWTNWYSTPVLKEFKAEASMYGAKVCAPKAPNSTALAPKNAMRYFMD